jgi:hypothetical protein
MFVGRSEEEIALAGEEMGWNPLEAVKNIFQSPAAVTAILGPAAGAAAGAALAIRTASNKQAAKPAAKSKSKQKEDTTDDGSPAPSDASDVVSKKASGGGTASMGASALSDEHIESLIARERDPDKKARMVYNHQRAKRMRGSSLGAVMGVVDDAIGQLFARTPVDAQSRPTMGASQVRQLVNLVGKKIGSAAKAKSLVASYVHINKIATPGLRVVRKG